MIAVTAAADTHLDAPQPGLLLVQQAPAGPAHLELPPATVAALVAITDGPVPVTELPSDEVSQATVQRLARDGVLHFSVVVDRREALRATLTGALSRFEASAGPGDAAVRLSRFALLRRHGDEFVVDAPVAGTRIALRDRRALAIIGELARPRTVGQLNTALLDCSPRLIEDTVRLLMGLGVAAVVDGDGLLAEDRDPVLRRRELPDVLLHAASRGGLSDQPVGVAGPVDVAGPLDQPVGTAAEPAPPGQQVFLPRPDPAGLRAGDPPLAAVLERLRGTPQPGRQTLTAAQVGEFLFRVAAGWPHPDGDARARRRDDRHGVADAAPELDLYLTVLHCSGLAPGIWHYQPAGHALTLVDGDRTAVLRMLTDAHGGDEAASRVLVTLASRWDRLPGYHGIAYATTLKHVGALYATMRLAAAAMGLFGRPLDTGDAALFAEVTGWDPAVGSSVGEFLLCGAPER